VLDTRLLPDGTATSFVVPEDHVLVLTGVSWFTGATSSNQTASVIVNLRVNPTSIQSVFFTGSIADVTGVSIGFTQIPHVVVKPGVSLCLGVTGPVDRGFVYGFLAHDKGKEKDGD
jgi:hypothetical protein